MVRRCHKIKDEALRKIIDFVCDGYIDTLLTGIEEYEKDFLTPLRVQILLVKSKRKNILVDFNIVFDDSIIDMVFRETCNCLVR